MSLPALSSLWPALLLGMVLWAFLASTPALAQAPANGKYQAYQFGQNGTALGAGPRLGAFLKKVTPTEIFPGADRIGPPEGKPTIARAYAGDKLLGYVYLTTDIVNTRGYSSKPIDTLVGISLEGEIVGAKLVEHHEPIVLIGIPESKVENFIQGYVGKNYVKEPPRPGAPPPVDIVSGATVTLMVIGDSITRSVMAVARDYGIGRAGQAQAAPVEQRAIDMEKSTTESWDALLKSGAVSRLHVTVADINKAFEQSGKAAAAEKPESGDPDDTFVDLYTALVSAPGIGKSLLGDTEYQYLRDRLAPGQSAILVAGNGRYSFKGSGYVRGGVFDRIEVIQQENSFHFTDLDHTRLADLMAAGAPNLKEIALFTVPTDAVFDPVAPWRLQLTVQRVLSVKEKAFTTLSLNYTLPQAYTKVVAATPPAVQTPPAAGTPDAALDQTETGIEEAPALWKQMWAAKIGQIIVIAIALLTLIAVFFFQDQLTKHEVFYQRFRTGFLIFTLFWIGWYAQAQLSVVNVLTFTTSLRTDFSWEYFLMDPLVFILWVATAMSLIFWNRGAFCGWLCPFGALQELANKVAKRLHVPQIKVPHGVNTRLAGLKYIIFLILFGVSLYELGLAEKMAEVEPFKTAIILKFARDWPFVLFALAVLIPGLFIERFYCRYMCPMGAALAIPARLRIFNWLRRYKTCGNPCQLCAVECPVQAINPEGDINPNECIQCLNCQQLYHNERRCPHLIQKNAKLKRHKAPPPDAGLPGEVVVSRKPTVRPRTPADAAPISSNP
ncbi:NosR/NirI family protein [Castellaniella caeni]|uniref:NosR/NirI family protein n=1 Tax=Castellaniella caeni TaxID=266123 RepID=UPI001E5F6B04|nr:NosR/NirI family protein [Castellaniella caeni]